MNKGGKKVLIHEEWRRGWSSPDIYVIRKDGSRLDLKEHTCGKCPFIKYQEELNE